MKAILKLFNNHWIMMASMILMSAAGALAMYGANTSFLNIGVGYLKHMSANGFQAIGAGLKGLGVAAGNLISTLGFDPGSLVAVDPATMSSAGASLMPHSAAAPLKTSALDALHVTDKFASAATNCVPALAENFGHAAHMMTPDVCSPSPAV